MLAAGMGSLRAGHPVVLDNLWSEVWSGGSPVGYEVQSAGKLRLLFNDGVEKVAVFLGYAVVGVFVVVSSCVVCGDTTTILVLSANVLWYVT